MCHAVNPSLVAFGILPFATLVHPCTAEARRPHPCGRRAHKATPPRHVQGEYDKVELMLVTMQCCCRRLCQRMAVVALIEVREYAMDGISVSGRRMSVPVFPPSCHSGPPFWPWRSPACSQWPDGIPFAGCGCRSVGHGRPVRRCGMSRPACRRNISGRPSRRR